MDDLREVPKSRVKRELTSISRRKESIMITRKGEPLCVLLSEEHPIYEFAMATIDIGQTEKE